MFKETISVQSKNHMKSTSTNAKLPAIKAGGKYSFKGLQPTRYKWGKIRVYVSHISSAANTTSEIM
jgi:hypothetical protein